MLTISSMLCVLGLSSLWYGSAPAAPPNSPFDSYGILRWEDETARLDNFAIHLQNYEKALGFILVYDETGGCPGEAQARAIRAKRYIVEHRGLRWNQVIWRREGYRMDAGTTLVIAPPGAYVPYRWGGPSTDPAVDGPLTAACKATLRKIRKSRW
ncbi:MAG TPA: hypothetical protein VFY34_11525 [Pyrinomonadaceae bacterium]|jgi:hypothetical protein|nr:hypothetical protein [Pyrinomonadaceae bacterium]